MSGYRFKRGVMIIDSARRHRIWAINTHGEPMVRGVSRVGTKRWQKAGSGGGKSRGYHGGNGGLDRKDRIERLNYDENLRT
jgi:hypothetical protein